MTKLLLILFIFSCGIFASEQHDKLFNDYIASLAKNEQIYFTPVNKLQKNDSAIYEKKLVFRFYRKGFLMAYQGQVEKVLLRDPSPKQKSGKTINKLSEHKN
ncbi:hypothetical protein PQO03_03590 [Lentisphaera profundi]|uniref:Uncharacterized protein n=1 Tax=Lentisphaera profundi TaxID=1658616 RepID=A0ABY7VTF4_9BACT|nr:hypothetical protein [Lentisphaera profundi]WDE97039.1 hypothetical protein PQO03_03590 [Lentisphaera profundi]